MDHQRRARAVLRQDDLTLVSSGRALMKELAALTRRDAPADQLINTTLVLALAAWLIFNSHLEKFYPAPWLATDGLLGNTLFFWVSGYGVQSSLQRRPGSFKAYAARRLLRIYPSVVLILLTYFALLPDWRPASGVWDIVAFFAWPTPYTYIRMIVPFYVLLWILWRTAASWALPASIAVACALYAVTYAGPYARLQDGGGLSLGQLPQLLWWSYFWAATASGAMMARLLIRGRFSISGLISLAALLILYLAAKYVMVVNGSGAGWFPVLQLVALLSCGAAIVLCSSAKLVRSVLNWPVLGPLAALSANLTLEIYLVHDPLSRMHFLYALSFPFNILAIIAVTLSVAIPLNLCASAIRGALEQRRPES